MTQEDLLADDTQYCCYCGCEKARFQCCGENHFQTFAQMSAEEQDEFLDNEECAPLYTSTQPHKPWVGLTDEEVEQVFSAIATYHAANKTLYRSIARAIWAKLKEKNT